MDLTAYQTIPTRKRADYSALLFEAGLIDEGGTDCTVLAEDEDGALMGTVSLSGSLIKQLAVSPLAEGEGLAASLLSRIIAEANALGRTKLFIYTKPKNKRLITSMGFYPIIETADALMTENRRNGFSSFLDGVRQTLSGGADGAIVANANPFTLGHRHLIEYAAARVDRLAVFVLSTDSSLFDSETRYRLVKEGTADIPNVTVVRGGDYLISRETFPTYFIKERARAEDVRCDLDLMLFARAIAPALSIKTRFIGEEPFDPVTRAYNRRMQMLLPEAGIRVVEIPRLNAISASRVRNHIHHGELDVLRPLVPNSTYAYCREHLNELREKLNRAKS